MPIIERRKGFFSQKKKEVSPFNKIEEPNTIKQGENTIEGSTEEPISSKSAMKSILILSVLFFIIGSITFAVLSLRETSYTEEEEFTEQVNDMYTSAFDYTQSSDSIFQECLTLFNTKMEIYGSQYVKPGGTNQKRAFLNDYFNQVLFIRSKLTKYSFEFDTENYLLTVIEFLDEREPVILKTNFNTLNIPFFLFQLEFENGKPLECLYNNVDLNNVMLSPNTTFNLHLDQVFQHVQRLYSETAAS